ncbi:klhl36 [Symbiodinium sp. CCMP2456]|nr:klhl36 [Symbiodinium sp. CCMP2456]
MTATIDAEMVLGLIQIGDLQGLQEFSPRGFDWAQPLCNHKLPALIRAIDTGVPDRELHDQCLAIVEWLLKVGADPAQRLPGDCNYYRALYDSHDREATEIHVEYAGHSSMSLAVTWLGRLKLRKGGTHWSNEENYMKRVIALLSRSAATKNPRAAEVTVPQGTFDLWESMRDLTTSHSVIFECSDGKVSAHDQILMLASPVLTAMLTSAMKEGSSWLIQVKDSSYSGVSLFLDVLYTSSTRTDPDHETMLVALDLAHRWQVHSVVQALCSALCDMIDVKSFAAIAEAAVLKGLEVLQRACASFGSTDKQVQGMLTKGSLPAAVRKLLGESEHASSEQQEPKKRRLFR